MMFNAISKRSTNFMLKIFKVWKLGKFNDSSYNIVDATEDIFDLS